MVRPAAAPFSHLPISAPSTLKFYDNTESCLNEVTKNYNISKKNNKEGKVRLQQSQVRECRRRRGETRLNTIELSTSLLESVEIQTLTRLFKTTLLNSNLTHARRLYAFRSYARRCSPLSHSTKQNPPSKPSSANSTPPPPPTTTATGC